MSTFGDYSILLKRFRTKSEKHQTGNAKNASHPHPAKTGHYSKRNSLLVLASMVSWSKPQLQRGNCCLAKMKMVEKRCQEIPLLGHQWHMVHQLWSLSKEPHILLRHYVYDLILIPRCIQTLSGFSNIITPANYPDSHLNGWFRCRNKGLGFQDFFFFMMWASLRGLVFDPTRLIPRVVPARPIQMRTEQI